MATLSGLVLQIIEAAWDLSLDVIPLLYLGFLGYALAEDRSDDVLETMVRSQRSYTLEYGIYITAGLLVGGIPAISTGGLRGTVLGGTVVLLSAVYGHSAKGLPGREELDLETWRGRYELLWIGVPVIAAVALLTGSAILKSLTALVFLSAVFWEV